MTDYNELNELQQKIARKRQLEAKLAELQNQKRAYDREVISLRVALRQEQEDVQKLEGRSLANYFYKVIGKLDGKLDKERVDAYAAKVKLDAAQRQLADAEEDVQSVKIQLAEIYSAQARYDALLETKRATLRESGTAAADKILELEQRIAQLQSQKKEIKEAVSAGYSARGTAERILAQLDEADGWNTLDLIGGGIVTHVVKHSHLDEAQYLVEELQNKLRRFKTELADVRVSADMQVNIDGFLRFADYFFDGLFADWAVMDRISQSRSSVSGTINQINQTLKRISGIEASLDREITALEQQIDELIVEA